MFHEFPYTNFSEMNLDWLVCMCKKNEGLHLAIVGDTLRLLNKDNEVISNVTISYAEKALTDVDGRPIKSYIISAGTAGDTIVFTHGDQVVSSITVPYAEKAKYDLYNNEITDYVLQIAPAGDKIRVVKGDQSIAEFQVPFAIQASQDTDGNAIQTYACDLTVDGQNVQLRDRAGRVLSAITVPFAVHAGDAVEATHAVDADHAINADDADHADEADSADYALLSTDATNAIETVQIVGDQVKFTTYGGVETTLTIPFSTKAQKDDVGNTIKTTYVAGVSTNASTGEISFLDALGNVITTIVPQVEIAKKDTYNNLIADYIKSIITDSNSNYVTVTHGTGTVDSILINYATKALNDLNNQAIHNTYISLLTCVEDVDDGHWKIVAWDGDTPKAELFRLEVYAYAAQCDVNGKALTSYVADLDITNNNIVVKDGENNTLETLPIPSYWMDTDDTYIELHRESETISNFPVPTIQLSISSPVTPWNFNATSFTSSDVSCNMSSLQVLSGITDNACVWVHQGLDTFIATVKSQYQDGTDLTTIFESAVENNKVWQITLVTSSLGAFVSCTGDVIDLSGGGGGSSSIEEIVISQIGTSDANWTNLFNTTNGTITVSNGPSDYKTKWTDSSKTYVLKLQQDGTLIYLTQRLKQGSGMYMAFATVQKYDYNDPQTHVIQLVCSGQPLNSFNIKKCIVQ